MASVARTRLQSYSSFLRHLSTITIALFYGTIEIILNKILFDKRDIFPQAQIFYPSWDRYIYIYQRIILIRVK
jgi:hypothetical protein